MAIVIDIHKPVEPERLEKIQGRLTPVDMNFINMALNEIPLSPGFIIPITESILSDKPKFRQQLSTKLSLLEQVTNKKLGASSNPLLLRLSRSSSMKEAIEPCLDYVGITEKLINSANKADKEEGLYQLFNRYIEDYAERTQKKPVSSTISDPKEKNKEYLNTVFEPFKADPKRQLESAMLNLAKYHLESDKDTMGRRSLILQVVESDLVGTVKTHEQLCIRDIHSGEIKSEALELERLDVEKIIDINSKVERYFLDACTIDFYLNDSGLQVLNADIASNRTVKAKLNLLCDLYRNETITAKQMVNNLNRPELRNLLLPIINESSIRELKSITAGIAGAPGAAAGRVFFSTKALLEYFWEEKPKGRTARVILLKSATYGEDVQAIELGQGVISSEGGYSSHAPVVA
ncbi:MAG: hypothetical protein HOD92_20725, partial [Deltaproteobacteria bacterium]|nr:hypothetical protein [Deltaproteobacteria bacterium]